MKLEKLTEARIIDGDVSTWILNGENDLVKNYFKENPEQIGNTYRLPYGQDLVMFSVYADNKEIFDWLLENGAKALADKKGFTPLHQAAINPNPYYVNKLVKFGLKIDRHNKKTETPLAFLVDYVARGTSGTGGILSKSEKLDRAKKLFKTFKALIDNGADMKYIDNQDDPIIVTVVKGGIYIFFEEMIKRDKTLLDTKYFSSSLLQIAMANFKDEIVSMILDSGVEIEMKDAVRFITNTSDTETALKLYGRMSEDDKKELKIETMMSIDNGKEKMIRLFKAGVVIHDRFVMSPAVQKIADELMDTDRKAELLEMAVRVGIEVFYPDSVKDIFVF